MSNTEEIKKLYYSIDELMDDYRESPEVKEAHNEFMAYLDCNGFFDNDSNNERKAFVDDVTFRMACASECQGFIFGFKYAVRLLIGQMVAGDGTNVLKGNQTPFKNVPAENSGGMTV